MHNQVDAAAVFVSVGGDDPETAHRAELLAQRFGFPFGSDPSALQRGRPAIIVGADRTEWRGDPADPRSAVAVDFAHLDTRAGGAGLSRRQPLARGLGRSVQTIVDATAGLGQDAFLLACLGYDVTAVERSPVLALLLEDALERAALDERLHRAAGNRLRIVHADARQYLSSLEPAPDAVFVDPMFPPKRRASALPPKRAQMLRRVVGDDEDAGELLVEARRCARRRVVVKRPTHAPPLAPSPDATHEGKLIRYDVYVTPGGAK